MCFNNHHAKTAFRHCRHLRRIETYCNGLLNPISFFSIVSLFVIFISRPVFGQMKDPDIQVVHPRSPVPVDESVSSFAIRIRWIHIFDPKGWTTKLCIPCCKMHSHHTRRHCSHLRRVETYWNGLLTPKQFSLC